MNDVINIHMAVDRKKDSHPCKVWIEKFNVYRIMTRGQIRQRKIDSASSVRMGTTTQP